MAAVYWTPYVSLFVYTPCSEIGCYSADDWLYIKDLRDLSLSGVFGLYTQVTAIFDIYTGDSRQCVLMLSSNFRFDIFSENGVTAGGLSTENSREPEE